MRELSGRSDLADAVRRSLATPAVAGDLYDLELHVDVETRSELDLTVVGLDRYSKHSSTQIILASWVLVDPSTNERIETCQWDYSQTLDKRCERLVQLLENPRIRLIAHNAQFERTIFRHVWKVNTPIYRWRCSMALAFMMGMPGSLEKLGEITKMPDEFLKVSHGKKFINKFCKTQKPTKKLPRRFFDKWSHPTDWEDFKFYNRQDVEAEIFLWTFRLLPYCDVLDEEWAMWELDQEINDRGLPIDREFVTAACQLVDEKTEELLERLARLTGLENPNSDPQFGPWARARGYAFGDMRKETIKRVLDDAESAITAECREAFLLRAQLKRTAVKKFFAIGTMNSDGWLRFQYQYCGAARTGRWAGRGAQPQNPARPEKVYKPEKRQLDIIECVKAAIRGDQDAWDYFRLTHDQMAALSSTVRASVRAALGYRLVVADLSSIESVVVAWLSRCESKLQAFRDGLDPYKHFATIWMKKDYDAITPEERNMAKNPELGCGFGLGGGDLRRDPKSGDMKKTGMWAYSERNGIPLTREQSHDCVFVYREAFPEVVNTWYAYEAAAKKAIGSGNKVVLDHCYINGFVHDIEPITFDMNGPYLRVTLPSGRKLHYLRPMIEKVKTPWGEEKWTITYEGMEDDDDDNKFWGRTPTRGAKIFENVVQAVANDLLRSGMRKAKRRGFTIVLHAHDEIGAHEKIGSPFNVEQLIECVTDNPYWARTMPVAAKGVEQEFWYKD